MVVKTVVLNTVAVLVGVSFIVSLEVAVRQVPNDHSLKRSLLDKHGAEIETVVLGNSHALYGVNPEFLKHPAANVANVSQTLEFDSYILATYAPKLTSLKTVMIPMSYFSIRMKLSEHVESWRVKNYRLYWGYPAPFPIRNNFELMNGFGRHVKSVFRFYVRKVPNTTCSDAGFGLRYHHTLRPVDWPNTGKAAARRHTMALKRDIVEENSRFLREIVKICRDRGVRVILFTPPAWKTYVENLSEEQMEEVRNLCLSLSRAEGVEYVDLLKDPLFAESDFFDADHMNEKGAEKLTVRLQEFMSTCEARNK